MNQGPKTFLIVLEINNVLFYLNNPKFKKVDSHANNIPVTYHDKY